MRRFAKRAQIERIPLEMILGLCLMLALLFILFAFNDRISKAERFSLKADAEDLSLTIDAQLSLPYSMDLRIPLRTATSAIAIGNGSVTVYLKNSTPASGERAIIHPPRDTAITGTDLTTLAPNGWLTLSQQGKTLRIESTALTMRPEQLSCEQLSVPVDELVIEALTHDSAEQATTIAYGIDRTSRPRIIGRDSRTREEALSSDQTATYLGIRTIAAAPGAKRPLRAYILWNKASTPASKQIACSILNAVLDKDQTFSSAAIIPINPSWNESPDTNLPLPTDRAGIIIELGITGDQSAAQTYLLAEGISRGLDTHGTNQ